MASRSVLVCASSLLLSFTASAAVVLRALLAEHLAQVLANRCRWPVVALAGWPSPRPFWQCVRSRARVPVSAAPFARLATISRAAFGHPASSGPRQASLHFSFPSTSVTVQMQLVVASFTGKAMPGASRLARSLPSCAGWCTCVAPNPLVKGTSCAYAQAAPYRER